MKEVRDAVAGLMEKMTLADLVQRARQLLSEPASESDYTI
jgi:DNA-binding IscR family transcriptional regulator